MADLTHFEPVSDFLVVKMDPVEEHAVLWTPQGGRDAFPLWGRVVRAGPGLPATAVGHTPMPALGDAVLLQINAGTEVSFDGASYRVVPARDLFGVVRADTLRAVAAVKP